MDSNTACDWYTGRSCVGCYIWFSKEGPGRAAAHPVRSSLIPKVTTHQRPMYQLHIIRRDTLKGVNWIIYDPQLVSVYNVLSAV